MSAAEFYAEMAQEIVGLLDPLEFGAPILFKRTTGQVRNNVTGQITTQGTNADFTPNGILKPYPDRMIDGTRILASDRLLVIDARVEPLPTDKPTVQAETWSIKDIVAANPTGVPLAYFVQVAR